MQETNFFDTRTGFVGFFGLQALFAAVAFAVVAQRWSLGPGSSDCEDERVVQQTTTTTPDPH